MSSIDKSTKVLLLIFVIVPAGIAIFIWASFVTKTIWNWFAVPILNAPELTIVTAMGLGAVVATFTLSVARKHDLRSGFKDPEDSFDRAVFNLADAAFMPTFLLGFAWVIKGFM